MALTDKIAENQLKARLYPNPFFSLADFYMPADITKLFKWCSYFYEKDPIIGATVDKLSEYPITDLIYKVDGDDEQIVKQYEYIFEKVLKVKEFLQAQGKEFFVKGNAFFSIYFPFSRVLSCRKCNKKYNITENDNIDSIWKLKFKKKEPSWELECECGHKGDAEVNDIDSKVVERMNFVRWRPEHMTIDYYPLTGKSKYYYDIPKKEAERLRDGKDKYAAKTTPLFMLDAIAQNKQLELNDETLFHWKRETLTGAGMGWGKPLILHSMQRLFYLHTLRRAQEAIATQHVVPMDIISPAIASGDASVYKHVNLVQWATRIRSEVKEHRKDYNYIPIVPIPINVQRFGGDGRMLLLGAEVDQGSKEVVAGMGTPLEFVFGGLSWSGSSVSLRMLENMMQTYRSNLLRLLEFIAKSVKIITGLPRCEVRMSKLRMADDVQRQQLMMQMNASMKLSDNDFLAEIGIDYADQTEKIKAEAAIRDKLARQQSLTQIKAQGEGQILQSGYQARAQIEYQKITNHGQKELEKSLPYVTMKQQQIDALSAYLNSKLSFDQILVQADQMNQDLIRQMQEAQQPQQPPPAEGEEGAPPEGEEEVPPEGEEEAAPAEEEGVSQDNPAMSMAAKQEMGQGHIEQPSTPVQQYASPYYQRTVGPDDEAILKRHATAFNNMRQTNPGQAAAWMQELESKSPQIAAKIRQYADMIPLGGTAQDGADAMKPLPENRPPRRDKQVI